MPASLRYRLCHSQKRLRCRQAKRMAIQPLRTGNNSWRLRCRQTRRMAIHLLRTGNNLWRLRRRQTRRMAIQPLRTGNNPWRLPAPLKTRRRTPPPSNKHWYVVKVQSGREDSIKESIERRVKIEGLDDFFGQIIIPMEKVTEMVRGKRVVKERKLYPGYLMVEVEYNDQMLYLFRETSGVGDFVGGSLHRAPPPMPPREVERMLGQQGNLGTTEVKPKPQFDRGDRVKVRDGIFAGMEGEVKEILEAKATVKIELMIFGRPTSVELEYWQVEHI